MRTSIRLVGMAVEHRVQSQAWVAGDRTHDQVMRRSA